MRLIPVLVLLAAFVFPSILSAQAVSIKGKVLDETGNPLPYAVIAVKGTRIASAADKSGDFSMNIPEVPCVLVITSVGFDAGEYKVSSENRDKAVKVILKRSSASLDEVVVTGLTKTTERNMASETFSGRLPGVAVESSGKERPAIDLRKEGRPGSATATSSRGEPVFRSATSTTTDKHFSSRILTAGELSDFKKWKLWGDYNNSEFRSFSDHWMMGFRRRYCVQVQNKEHKPVVGEPVYLLDEDSRDTVWQAVTDNTGKAELWADEDPSGKGQSDYNIICSYQSLRSPVPFENGINRIVLKRACNISNNVDIAFMVDATGSMGDEIQYLQAELQDIIDRTSAKYKEVNLRLGSVFYRDKGDEYVTRVFDFNTDSRQLTDFIRKQSARGGGDFPEAVDAAMDAALGQLKWSAEARTKILFLVLDAPPHDADREKMKSLVRKAAAMGIRIVPIACSGINKSTEYLLRCAALATNGSYIFLTDDSGVGNPHIKPTTDEFKVELLNELLQRLIGEMIYAPTCNKKDIPELPVKDTIVHDVQVLVYPNPTHGKVTIESTGTIKEVYVTDFAGKVLMKLESAKNKRKWQLHLSTYPSGTYLVKYFIEEKGWKAEKVILLH